MSKYSIHVRKMIIAHSLSLGSLWTPHTRVESWSQKLGGKSRNPLTYGQRRGKHGGRPIELNLIETSMKLSFLRQFCYPVSSISTSSSAYIPVSMESPLEQSQPSSTQQFLTGIELGPSRFVRLVEQLNLNGNRDNMQRKKGNSNDTGQQIKRKDFWTVPTSIIHSPLSHFTIVSRAVRSVVTQRSSPLKMAA